MEMEKVKLEGTWEELMLSLRKIRLNLGVLDQSRPIDLDGLMKQMVYFIDVVHNLFNELEKPAEEK